MVRAILRLRVDASSLPVRSLLSGLAPLLFLVLILWLVTGGPERSRKRREARPRRDRSFWGLPSRDRTFAPGALLVGLAVVTLAEVVMDAASADEGSLVVAAAFFGAVVAIGFALRPDIVKAGMGILGIVTLVLERLGARGCADAATTTHNLMWLLAAGLLAIAVFGINIFVAPMRAVSSATFRPATSFWRSAGEVREGRLGSQLLVVFGLLSLLDLVLRPDGVEALREALAGNAGLAVFLISCLGIVIVGLALLPNFTTSAVGIGVGLGSLALLGAQEAPCRNVPVLIGVAAGFWLIAWLAGELADRRSRFLS